MKKSLILIICFAMVLALCACGGKSNEGESKPAASEVSAAVSADNEESKVGAESAEGTEGTESREVTNDTTHDETAENVSADSGVEAPSADDSNEDTATDDSNDETTADDSNDDVSVPDITPGVPNPAPSNPVAGEGLKASYKWIKTWYDFDMGLPCATVVTSPAELTTYYLNNKSILNATFKTLINTYEDSFFENKVLILVAGMEGSGSITHELRSAVLAGDTLTLTIARIVPFMGTDNEMGWHLFAEIDKACLAGKDNIVINMVDE